jgi:chaperonin cofactor prefoldin
LTNQLKEERKQRMELEMKLNEMSELLAELEKIDNREGLK